MARKLPGLLTTRHPNYLLDSNEWLFWRDTFEGGENYRNRHLVQFSKRETPEEFQLRKAMTPIPTFAKSAVLDLRNSIYQRLADVTRIGGSKAYQECVLGLNGGVDGDGTTMTAFMGKDVLTELLIMGKCGIYVDGPKVNDGLVDVLAAKPGPPRVLYYPIEDILSFNRTFQGDEGQFTAVLLREYVHSYNTVVPGIELPDGPASTRYRLVWKDESNNVWVKLYNHKGEEGETILTGLTEIPFVIADIGDSLLKDTASYQKALLNLVSSDVDYAIRSNTTFLTVQEDLHVAGGHLKQQGTAAGGSAPSTGKEETLGSGKGRYYGKDMDRPDFISPSTDPLLASMKLQERLEDNIRSLINLAVSNKQGTRTESAEAKKLSSEGLDAGLSFIGMILQQAEQRVARFWGMTENTAKPNVATVGYPKRYILKTDEERAALAESLLDLAKKVPGKSMKREISKMIVISLLSGKEPKETIDRILSEIDTSDFTTSDPETIFESHKLGLVDDKTASEALGFNENLVEQARKDREARAVAILRAQTSQREGRGVPELEANPNADREEQERGREEQE
jgi:hypothetical protein